MEGFFMSRFRVLSRCVFFFAIMVGLVSCGKKTEPSSGGSDISGSGPDLLGMDQVLSDEGDSLTWSWRCPANLPEGHTCQFRYAITPASEDSHEFDDNQAYRDPSTSDGEEVIFNKDHLSYGRDGGYRIHIQYRVVDPLEEDEDDRVTSIADVRTYPVVTVEFRIPELTGLENATAAVQSQTWNWGCSEACTYRFIVNQETSHTFADEDQWGRPSSATKEIEENEDGVYYLHVQAKDAADKVSEVVSVSVELDITKPMATGPLNDETPTPSKVWNWLCDDLPCTYRYAVTQDEAPPNPIPGNWGDATTLTHEGVDDGTWYLHLQARDQAGNESDILSASAILQREALGITGLELDNVPKQSKTWTWDCTESPCDYRVAINQQSTHMFAATDLYDDPPPATQSSGDGLYYLHVQGKIQGQGGAPSGVVSVSAVLDNTAPTVTNVDNISGPTQSQTWNWNCSEASCAYRYVINQNQSHSFSSETYDETVTATKDSENGVYYLHVQAKDGAGNESVVATSSVTLDNTPPSVTGLTDDNTATRSKDWSWSCNESSCTYRLVVNQNPRHTFSNETFVSDTTRTHSTGDGTYYLHVQAKDQAGNDGAVISVSALLDNTPPTIVGLSNDSVPTSSKDWSWSCSDATGCEYRHAVNGMGQHTFEDTDTYSTTATASQGTGQGTYYLHVQVRDAVGNESAVVSVSAVLSQTVFEVTGLASDTVPTQNKTWSWGCSDDGPCQYRSVVNENPTHTFSSEPYTTTATTTKTGGDGTFYLHVQARDTNLRESPVATVSAVLDNTGPGVTGLVDDSDATQAKSWTWECDDAPCTYRFVANQNDTHTFSSEAFAATNTTSQRDGNGTFYLHVQAKDQAGNDSSVISVSAELDNTPPTLSGVSDDATPTASKDWAWSCSGGETCTYRHIINQDSSHTFTNIVFSQTNTVTKSDGNGVFYLHVQAQDSAGNESAVSSGRVVIDNANPVVTGLESDSTVATSKSWTWACSDVTNCEFRYAINQEQTHVFSSEAFDTTATATKDGANGTWYLHVQAKDELANESEVVSVSVELDNTVPVLMGVDDVTTDQQSQTWNWSCSGGETCTYRYVINQDQTHAFTNEAFTATAQATQGTGDGVYYLHVQAQDEAGNESTVARASVTMDNTAPVVTGLSDDTTLARSKSWNWGCTDTSSCRYHVGLNQNSSHTFDPTNVASTGTTATKDNADGVWYLHVQAEDEALNKSALVSVSVELDNTAPTLEGLSNDNVERRSKDWTWGCSNGETCTYRHVINTSSSPPNPMTGAWGDTVTASQASGDDTYYIHVQARDEVENVGEVVSVSAVLSSTAFSVTGLSSDPIPTKSKTWTWGCSGTSSCTYRFIVNQNSSHSFSSSENFGSTTTTTQSSGDGRYYLHVQTRNGNLTSPVTTVSVVMDNTAPGVTGLADDSTTTASKTWNWSCDQSPCTYRHVVNTETTHTFNTEAFTSDDTVTHSSGDGLHYLHVQAKDQAGNESTVARASVPMDTTGPTVTNLNDPPEGQSATWTWGCSESLCEYRFNIRTSAVTQGAPFFVSSDLFGASNSAIQYSGNGTYHIYVQARDALGNEGLVVSSRASLDNTGPVIYDFSSEVIGDIDGPVGGFIYSWSCDETCTTRYAINQNSTHTFADSDAFEAPPRPMSSRNLITESGKWYLHIQAKDDHNNITTASPYVIYDLTPPTITGLSSDSTVTQSKTWAWGCSKIDCQYRYAINQNSSHTPSGGFEGTRRGVTQSTGTGTYYLHVQARDSLQTEGPVETVSFIIDNTPPSITGLADLNTPTKKKTWNWGCTESNCTYRHHVEQSTNSSVNAHTFSDSDSFGSVTSYNTPENSNWSGFTYIHVQARDTVGQESNVMTVRGLVDNTAPSVTGLSNDGTSRKSKTWNWGCSDNNSNTNTCTYRYGISQSSSHTFSSNDTFNSTTTATKSNVRGTYYLHVQAKDQAGNESSVESVSAVLEVGPPEVTGLSSDTTARWEANWDWACDDPPCTFRYVINASSSPPDPITGSWGSLSRAARVSNGTWYIHVQARNSFGEGPVATASRVVNFQLSDLSLEVHGTSSPRDTDYTWSCLDCNYRLSVSVGAVGWPPSTDSYSNSFIYTRSSGVMPSDLNHFVNLQARRPDGTTSPVVHIASYSLKRIDVGGKFTCALESGGTVKCWGDDDRLQSTGSGNGSTDQLYPGTVYDADSSGTVNGAVEITTGWKHACALLSNGDVKCWGQNHNGQTGRGSAGTLTATSNWSSAYPVSGLSNVMTIDAGSEHTCAVLRTGGIKCWGENDKGQLGDNSKTTRHTPVSVSGISNAIKVSGGNKHTCALLDNGKIKCWGQGNYGRLGNDSSSDSKVPVSVSLASSERAIDVSTGRVHTCAVIDNGAVKCWGGGGQGQLGDGNTGNHDTPTSVSGGITTFISVSAGGDHTCALRRIGGAGSVVCWGENNQGELGRNNYNSSNVPVNMAGSNRIDTRGQEVAAGYNHTCALLTSGEARCWGENDNGRLGTGSTSGSNPNSAQKVMASSTANDFADFGEDWYTVICSQIGSDTQWHCMSE